MKIEDIYVFSSLNDLAQKGAEVFADAASSAVREKGFFTVALSGGKTPLAMYERLAAKNVPWKDVHLFWGDERCVHPSSPESNFGSAYKNLISKVNIPSGNIHRMKGELDPAEAALDYDGEIKDFFSSMGAAPGIPTFDLVLLGLGEDGHTLSLFPSTDAINERTRLVAANHVPRLGAWRITMTLPLVNETKCAVFLVSGAEKSAVLKEVIEGDLTYPAALIRPKKGKLLWLVDKEAAKLL